MVIRAGGEDRVLRAARSIVWTGLVWGALCLPGGTTTGAETWKIDEVVDIAPAWSGHPVGFALLTHGDRQFVAFYDADRKMTVASRKLAELKWDFVRLPSQVKWDSHNYITMTVDGQGLLHLAGNMHCVPLIYFRTAEPLEIATLRRVESMIGREESRCTYPRFLRGSQGELIFTYRDGSSGNGNQIWNVWEAGSHSWRRLLDSPLFSGEGKMNAYFAGPLKGPDEFFHVCWVWRDTPDCATNHDLCYARSRDLVHWETSDGRPLTLPITLGSAEVVDPVPAGGGMVNGNTKIGFDSGNRPILSYHKYDENGFTQIYNARREADGWKIYRTSDWDYRWEFSGGGTIGFEIGVGPVTVDADGSLTQTYSHRKLGSGVWELDEASLRPSGKAPRRETLPREIGRLRSDRPGMRVKTAADSEESPSPGVKYLLRWETLPPNRDRPHPGDPPPPCLLQVYRLVSRA